MNYAALSLVFLIGAILIGFFRKINMGVCGLRSVTGPGSDCGGSSREQ